jgi:hypothetical protein
MPLSLPLPPSVTGRARHCVELNFSIPISAQPTATAHFVTREALDDGTTRDIPDGSVTIAAADLVALPVFADAYAQLSELVHAKRSQFD